MYSSGEPHFDLLTRFLPGNVFELPSAHFPGKLRLEGEGTPGPPGLDLLGPHTQQQQISHESYPDGAFHAGRIPGDLMLPQAHHPLQFFNTKLDVLQRIDTHPAFEVHLLTPRLWKQHFAANPLRSDLDRLCQ